MLSHQIAYQNRSKELSTLNGCVLWGARVVVPPCPVLILLYVVHSGLGNHQNVLTMECMFPTKGESVVSELLIVYVLLSCVQLPLPCFLCDVICDIIIYVHA